MLDPEDVRRLLEVATDSIRYSLEHDRQRLVVVPDDYPESLCAWRPAFVTLRTPDGELRGCVGSLVARQSLVEDVAWNAYNAAFNDPRFSPVGPEELARLDFTISILTPEEPISAADEPALLAMLQPGLDGLTLRCGTATSTLLPSVWESLPDPREFLKILKKKAGLAADFWSDELRFFRYRAEAYKGLER